MTEARDTHQNLTGYYRLHSRIYDATRWSFLFGRSALIDKLPSMSSPRRILEIGCGTGSNLARLGHLFPQAEVTGLDLSKDMLRCARRKLPRLGDRLRLVHRVYDEPVGGPFGLVLFSYSLSLFNPGWERALECAREDISLGGQIAVVDFHDTQVGLFSRWMQAHYVRLDGHLLHGLEKTFTSRYAEIRKAYSGAWRYFTYIGEKAARG